MPNHPNRSRRSTPAANPKPEEVRQARESAGLSQSAAAGLVYSGLRTWQHWESGDRRMHPAIFELFVLKSNSSSSAP